MTETTTEVAVVPDKALAAVQPLVRQVVLIAAVKAALNAEDKAVRALIKAALPPGSKATGFDPRDPDDDARGFGTATMSDPDKTTEITDEAVFEGWVRTMYADRLGERYVFGPAAEIAAVLREHAPHLIETHRDVIGEELRAEALRLAANGLSVPGARYGKPPSVLTVRVHGHGHATAAALLGTAAPVPLRALPARADA